MRKAQDERGIKGAMEIERFRPSELKRDERRERWGDERRDEEEDICLKKE